jgi:hypothetical protein
MNEADLDRSYTALCRALGDVGRERAELLLAMVALSLMTRAADPDEVQRLIDKARERCLQG